jgi:hypothetical protein
MQVAFAIQAVVDTSNSDAVNVYSLTDDISQEIPLTRIMQGQSFNEEDTVTGFELTSHSYSPIQEETEAFNAGETDIKEGGEFIFVKFKEPLHSIRINSLDYGELTEEIHENYAVVFVWDKRFVLYGKKYDHSTVIKSKKAQIQSASEIEKIVSVQNATLVSSSNVDKVLEKCYNWVTKINSTNLKIVDGKRVEGGDPIGYGQVKYGEAKYGDLMPMVVIYDKRTNVGDVISYQTEYAGTKTGRIIKQTFGLNGGKIIKDSVVK